MGYARNTVDGIGGAFLFLHEQVMLLPERGHLRVRNTVRKMIFLLQGECRHRIAGAAEEIDFRAGDILVVPVSCEHDYRSPEPGRACRLLALRLVFDPNLLPPLPIAHEPPPGAPADTETSLTSFVRHRFPQVLHLPGGQDALMRETLGQVRDEAQRRPPGHRLRLRGLCTELVTRVARQATDSPASPAAPSASAGDFHVTQAREYLLNHLDRPLRLAQVAAHVQVSEEHLARLFKQATGRTVFEYVRCLRFERAKDYLIHSDRNIGEIAALTGFGSPSVFSRTFHRDVGMSPSDYRRYVTGESGTVAPGGTNAQESRLSSPK